MSTHDPKAERETVLDIVEKARTGMLTTHDGDQLDARPMAGHLERETGTVWFLSDRTSHKVTELKADGAALVAYTSGNDYAVLRGTLRLVEDKAKVKEIWTPFSETFFPDGPEDPKIALLRFQSDEAQYWKSPSSGVIATVKFLQAKATGQRPAVGEHSTVTMR